MPSNLKTWLFQSGSFCCCIPVRAGFVLITTLTFLLSGAISIIIWFEISHSQLSSKERVAFFLAGIVESLLFLVSIFGFIGVTARKQLFVMIYSYFLYVHFVINVVVGVYFLVTVRASNRQQLVDYCANVFVNTSIESSCSGLASVSTYVFIGIVATLLLFELYGVLIVTRYMYRLRIQKRDNRSQRLGYFHALSQPEIIRRHTRQESDDVELLHPQESTDDSQNFDEGVIDIRPQSYMPLSTHDHDLPAVGVVPLLSVPESSSDSSSGRRIRALPPRPSDASAPPVIIPDRPGVAPESADRLERLPNPHEPWTRQNSRGFEPKTPDSEEVSSTTHAALMDHAGYMTMFTSPPPVPKYTQRLR